MSSPMVFGDDNAFNHLETYGVVLTARSKDKEDGPVWVRRTRNGEKEFDAKREKVWEGSYTDFVTGISARYKEAGFDKDLHWVMAVLDRQGEVPEEVHVYRVEKV